MYVTYGTKMRRFVTISARPIDSEESASNAYIEICRLLGVDILGIIIVGGRRRGVMNWSGAAGRQKASENLTNE